MSAHLLTEDSQSKIKCPNYVIPFFMSAQITDIIIYLLLLKQNLILNGIFKHSKEAL